MWTITNVLLCIFAVEAVARNEQDVMAERIWVRAKLNDVASVGCCYFTNVEKLQSSWLFNGPATAPLAPNILNFSDRVNEVRNRENNKTCHTLSFKPVKLSDTGLYNCFLSSKTTSLLCYGTYLHVYNSLDLSKKNKNKILTAEGIMLLLFVLLPATVLLCQSKRLNALEKKKVNEKEENIYQGLNLDDCCTMYDQINHSQEHGPYEDVCNPGVQEEIHLEKP